MFVARWQIDARFGHKQTVIDLMRKWENEIGEQVGLREMEFSMLSGSIGAREATLEADHRVKSLTQLEDFFSRIGALDAHRAWGKEIEPYVVSGSSRWEIFRVIDR
ncbi:hypothetical protein [Nitratireductor sp. ZSWI3]|uniref:hypothetical protein n=1 Tax=Nitratireductor sp. ZSWI3 TaxID=2966359 RepID=UPI002150279D|nr:hypothetical protein [Nitratireductor sp. ZSWI3]MCR4265105.1 hypothetical protein [Nitratireductor sp. ZSWI3]